MTARSLLSEAVQLLSHSQEGASSPALFPECYACGATRLASSCAAPTCADLLDCGPAVGHLVSRLAAATGAAVSIQPDSTTNSPLATGTLSTQRPRCSDALHLSETLRDLADEKLNSYPYHAVPACWRRLYTDASLYGAIARLANSSSRKETEREEEEAERLEAAIGRLDLAIVISGTPGPMRHDLALSLIESAQERLAEISSVALPDDGEQPRPTKRPRTRPPIREPDSSAAIAPDRAPYLHLPLTELPALPSFLDPKHNRAHRSPFIVREGASSFPAFSPSLTSPSGRRWSDLDYLRRMAGRGRIVPVEVGGDYTQAGWGQRMMEFGAFLDSLQDVERAASRCSGAAAKHRPSEPVPPPLYYLAQHSLFRQFPALLSDLLIPDLVYSPPTHHYSCSSNDVSESPTSHPASASTAGSSPPSAPPPQGDPYVSPTTEDGYILNAWLGPRGTKSAAHTDPWWNCYGAFRVGSRRRSPPLPVRSR